MVLVFELPPDVLARCAGYLCLASVCRLTGVSAEFLERLEANDLLWGQAVRLGHGGLRLVGEECQCGSARRILQRLSSARRAAAARAATGGFEALRFSGLATDGGTDDDQMAYWVDAMFRPEPWLVYSSSATRRTVLTAAGFRSARGGAADSGYVEDGDRAWMLERLRVAGGLFGDDFLATGLDAEPPEALELTFFEISRAMDEQGWLHEMVRDVGGPEAQVKALRAIRLKCNAIERRRHTSALERGSLDLDALRRRAVPFETVSLAGDLDDGGGVRFDATVHAALRQEAAGERGGATAIATSILVRRPTSYSCPAALGVVFGCARHPEPRDLEDPGLKAAIAKAIPHLRKLAPKLLDDDPLAAGLGVGTTPDGEYFAPDVDLGGLGRPVKTTRIPEGDVTEVEVDDPGAVVFPVAVFAFYDKVDIKTRRRGAREQGVLAATLERPRAIKGLVCALVDAEDRMDDFQDDHVDPNVDVEFVGFDGYVYTPGEPDPRARPRGERPPPCS